MSEVFKRDKKAVQLASLYATLKRDCATATLSMLNVWKEQLQLIWSCFEKLHEAVIDRSGAAELEAQQKTYDDASGVYYKANMLLGQLSSQFEASAVQSNRKNHIDDESEAVSDKDQLQRRHMILVQRFENICNRVTATIDNMNVSEIEIRRKDVEVLQNALREIALERMVVIDDPDTVMEIEATTDALSVATLKLLCDAKQQRIGQVGGANAMSDGDQLKVPRLQITPFDGRFENWEAFRESFTHGIHSRATMPAVQKLQYLKSVLRSEPEELIRNFGLTNENYESAWKLLNDRYNNRRELITSHIRILTSFRTCAGSADDLRRIINKTASSLMALHNLGRPIGEWNDWIVFHICEKLDAETRRLWEQNQGSDDELPTWNDLDKFLQGRIRALSAAGSHAQFGSNQLKPHKTRVHNTASSQRFTISSSTTAQPNYVCGCCSGNHLITFCEEFRRLSPSERRRTAAEKSLCFICLVTGHQALQCRSRRMCQICNLKHNSLLHLNVSVADQQLVQANTAACKSDVVESPIRILLATAMVNVRDVGGEIHQMRALLDQGSESSFVSERAADVLRLPRRKEKIEIVGLSGVATGRSNQSIIMCVSDRHGRGFSLQVHALVIPRVTNQLERVSIEANHHWPHTANLCLADPEYLRSHTIDILLGSDVYGTLLQPGLRKSVGLPTAQNTSFGWILSGKLTACPGHLRRVNGLPVLTHSITIDDQLAKFWEMEETSSERRFTAEEEKCEAFFEETVTRDASGRLHVRLPMKTSNIDFGESKRFAVQRQLQIERKFRLNPEFAKQYRLFMDQYCELGHMREVVNESGSRTQDRSTDSLLKNEYYIPHHAVIKEASTTTKLRVVFDASRRTTNGISLNDQMMIGPKLQDDLTAIIMRWRKYRIAFCADIEKMYRQIMVDEPDANLQRIVWRATTEEPMKVYQLRTVTYGTASAPYLAIKSLQTLAQLERKRFPVGANIVLNNFYVDDVLAGADTAQECIATQTEVTDLLESGGLALRKWASNCDDVLAQVMPAHRECQLPLDINDEKSISTLGVQWNPASDEIGFKIEIPDDSVNITKRTFLSAASRLYDPLGWLAPCIIVVKLLFQSLWKLHLDWDDALPAELARKWNEIRKSLHQLRDVRINRWIGMTSECKIEVHGFCDASMDAYAAVVYVRVTAVDQSTRVYNVCAKTRVAPVKVISLPRLELCGAQLLVKLIGDVINGMQLTETSVHCWTDSTIVLAWLRGHPSRFNVFVANRTAEIQRNFPSEHWRHVISADNPADCASRGISPQLFMKHQLWWNGPKWLCENQTTWPKQPFVLETTEEMRKSAHLVSTFPSCWELIRKYSNWRRLSRVTALCMRFIYNCRCRSLNQAKLVGALSAAELVNAREYWVRSAQSGTYPDELRSLRNKKSISKSSSLRALNPFLSTEQILRVGGRLANAHALTQSARSPAIVPRESELSALLISDAHAQTMHGGPSLMLAYLRRAYWVIGGPNEVRRFVNKCTVCFRYKAKPGHQLMASLPAARVTPSRPFRHCAMDYSGAIMVRAMRGRGHHASKAYVAVFVCLATKAVHIELAGDLTTNGFIAAYERFVSRRGICSDLYSDNATNFVGASTVFLRSERALFDSRVQNALASKGTTWHFSPPLSPHFNGLAESAIRSVKHHIRRVIGESTLTFEELTTVLTKIESCLNSRPICPMSSDPNDFDALTPGHFLIGEPTNSIPQKDLSECKPSTLTRWQLTHQMVQRFWKRWSAEYLHTLQQRRKWQSTTDNISIGDMVLVIEDNQPPAKWSLGRIVDVHPGNDGKVRVVTIRTRGSIFKRSIVKVARLPIDDKVPHHRQTTSTT